LLRRVSATDSGRRVSAGGARRAAGRELVGGADAPGVAVDQARLHLPQDLADRDAEDALPRTGQVRHLVVRGAPGDAPALPLARRLGEVFDACLAQLADGRADLLQRDARVEQALDELEHEDVAEAVEALRAGAGGAADGGLDELGAGPVVELTVADAGGTRRDGAAVAGAVVEVGQPVGEQEAEVVARPCVAGALLAGVAHADRPPLRALTLRLKLNFRLA